jgi:hypothetical protein
LSKYAEYLETTVRAEDIVWSLNPFELDDTFRVAAVMQMFDALGLIKRFCVPRNKLTAFVIKCRDSYRPENAFHNWCHAWSVTHCAYMIMTSTQVHRFLQANEILSILISCLVHDIDHPGVNSDYLIKTGSALALKFPYRNVLEHMHWFNAKKLFQEDCDTDFLENVTPGVKEEILLLVHEGIMATDMQNHKAIVESLNARCRRAEAAGQEAGGDGGQRAETEGHTESGEGGGKEREGLHSTSYAMVYDIHDPADRLELLQVLLYTLWLL